MMRFVLPSIALALIQSLCAQTQNFDIASFIPPAGFSRTDSNGILILQDRRNVRGRQEFCQIYLFQSRLINASAANNFLAEWTSRIAAPLGLSSRPVPAIDTTSDGWTTMTAFADVVKQGVPMRAILVVFTASGRSVSAVVTVSPNAYQTEIETFFKNLNFSRAGSPNVPGTQPTGGVPASPDGANPSPETPADGSLASYVYTVPNGWTRTESRNGIVLRSGVYPNGETCQITMLPMRSASGPLDNIAIESFREIFRTDPLTSYPSPPPKLAKGMSPQGWEYFTIRKLVGGQEGESRTMGTILLAARAGSQSAMIVATSKDFLVSKCFGELALDAWPGFFYSLQFKNVRPSGNEHADLQQRLAGSWMTATSSVGLHYTFLANGRYASTGAAQQRTRISNTEVLQTTQAYFGDGAYTFDGNSIVLTGDDHRRRTFLFRLEQQSSDSGRTWTDGLCMLEPMSTGEVCYRRE